MEALPVVAGGRVCRKSINPYTLCAIIREQKDTQIALQLFENPNPEWTKPFRRSYRSYDLIVERLGRSRMFDEMERILTALRSESPRIAPREPLFCNVIRSYGRARLAEPAIRTFNSIPSFGCLRTVRSVNSLLNALFNCREFAKILDLHADIDSVCVPDACTYNILIKACCFVDSIGEARDFLAEMNKRRILPDSVTFVTLISHFCKNLDLDEAFRLKDEMTRIYGLNPTLAVYTSLIKGICATDDLPAAFRLKKEMEARGMRPDSGVYSTLMTGIFRSGLRGEIDVLLKEMQAKGCEGDTVFYNSMINGFCKSGEFNCAFATFDEMVGKNRNPDVFTFNTLIGSLCNAGRIRDAMDVFEEMPRWECTPDVVTYRMVFDGLCNVNEFEDAAFILDEMLFKGFTPLGENLKKLVDSLCEASEWKLLESVLNSVSNRSVVEMPIWETAIRRVGGNCDTVKSSMLIDFIAGV